MQKSVCFTYVYNCQGANVGVASRRKPAKSWNTMVNEENEKRDDVEDN